MIYKIVILIACSILFFATSRAQSLKKGDLYLYFQKDSTKRIYKTNVTSKLVIRKNKKNIPAEDYDIYNYSYISADGKTERIYKLLSTINKANFCISDGSIFKKFKVLPYRNLEKIKGFISPDWNNDAFKFKRVFIIEKKSENEFKIIQVQLYFPFDSNGFMSRPVGSKDIIEIQ